MKRTVLSLFALLIGTMVVLAQTGFLESFPARRLLETAQMVVDVNRVGGLDPD